MSDYINSLPNELLLVVFDRTPLAKLLLLDQVCHRWTDLLPTAFSRRRTLVLIIGGLPFGEMDFVIPFNDDYKISFDTVPFYDLSEYDRAESIVLPFVPRNVPFDEYVLDDNEESEGYFDILYRASMAYPKEEHYTANVRLRVAHFSHKLTTYLSNLFPKVRNLVVISPQCNQQDLASLIGLVGSWPLVTLKLWTGFTRIDTKFVDRNDQHPVRSLLQAMGRQRYLQQLTLNIYGDGDRIVFPASTYSFLDRSTKVLKLCLGNYDGDEEIWNSVNRVDSDNLRKIGLADFNFQLDRTPLNPRFGFTHKVDQLYWELRIETVERLSQFCGRYCSLTMLRVHWLQEITFTQFITNLATLRQLTHLSLFMFLYRENSFALASRDDDDCNRGGEEEPQRISLPSVKILELNLWKFSHLDFESLPPFVFPSVETIILKDKMSRCDACQLDGRLGLGTGQCHRELLLSIKDKFSNSLVRLYSMRGFDLNATEWIDWSNYLQLEDSAFPVIADIADAAVEEDEDDEDDEDDFEDEGEVEGEVEDDDEFDDAED